MFSIAVIVGSLRRESINMKLALQRRFVAGSAGYGDDIQSGSEGLRRRQVRAMDPPYRA
jgi:hypothetical protein